MSGLFNRAGLPIYLRKRKKIILCRDCSPINSAPQSNVRVVSELCSWGKGRQVAPTVTVGSPSNVKVVLERAIYALERRQRRCYLYWMQYPIRYHRCAEYIGIVMDRITATATAVNRMLVWQPQPRCGCEYHNRNRGYFFQQPRIF